VNELNIFLQRFNSLLTKLPNPIPEPYWSSPVIRNSLCKWLLLAVLIRFLVMPISCYGDFISGYHSTYQLFFENNLKIINPQNVIQGVFLYPASVIIPLKELIGYSGFVSVPQELLQIQLANTDIFRSLFFLKIPYLVFDIGCAVLFLNLFPEKPKTGLKAYKFWLLNPLTIYAFYIIGRFDVIAIFFILLCCYFVNTARYEYAALAIGIAIWGRYYAILLLPLFILIVALTWKDYVKLSILGILPLAIFDLFSFISKSTSSSEYIVASEVIAKSHFIKYILAMNFTLDDPGMIGGIVYIFPLIFFIILIYLYIDRKNSDHLVTFSKYSLVVLLAYFVTCPFHPQFVSWFIPFLTIIYAITENNNLITLHCIQIIGFIIYWFRAFGGLTTDLFTPVYPDGISALLSPYDLINQVYSAMTITYLGRTAISAVCIVMIIIIVKDDLMEIFQCRKN